MGCGNAVQTAKEEFGHIKRENDEMRTNLNQLKVRADTSSMQLTREVQKASELKATLELIQNTLLTVGRLLAQIDKQCFGGKERDLSGVMEPEELVRSVGEVMQEFERNVGAFLQDLQGITQETVGLVQDCKLEAVTLEAPFPAIKPIWAIIQSHIHQQESEIAALHSELSRQSKLLTEQQALATTLEQTLASQGLHLADCESGDVSFEAEVEVASSVSDASSD